MNDEAFRRIVWALVLLGAVAVWAFAIIGIRATFGDCSRISVWSSLEKPLP